MKQLWHMDRIKELDFPSPIGFMKVGDFLPQVIEEVNADYSTQYAILRKSLREHGQLVPLYVSRDFTRLRDGIHRIAIAVSDLKWNFMDVDNVRRTTDWDNTEEGQRYWQLWNWRLRGFHGDNRGQLPEPRQVPDSQDI
jgi:hypothetical protein